MAHIDLTESTFSDTIAENDVVVVDWWAAWCGPCRAFAPVFEQAARRHPEMVFAKVDTDANAGLSQAAGIRSSPTLMVFREQVLVYSQPGALPAAALEEVLTKVMDLDMDEVHRAVAASAESSS